MIDLETYLKYNDDSDLYASHEEDIRDYNRNLVEKYPWLRIRVWNPENKSYEKDTDFLTTWLDSIPSGWRLAFSKQMCDEIQAELERTNYVDDYVVLDVKEKWARLDWSSGSIPSDSKLFDIIDKYCDMSAKLCHICGKKAFWRTTGYILPYCDECAHKAITYTSKLGWNFVEIED